MIAAVLGDSLAALALIAGLSAVVPLLVFLLVLLPRAPGRAPNGDISHGLE
jgi:hypothetical protein